MWLEREVIIASDLHLAAERKQGLFRADTELQQFFSWVLKEVPDSTIILAGDVFDYLIAEEKTNSAAAFFNLQEAPERTRFIIAHHEDVFEALAQLAQSPHHQLVILGGNHDPELACPAVQEVISARLSGSSSHPPIKWLVNGEAATLQVGAVRAVIEHGDMYDDWNRIDRDSLGVEAEVIVLLALHAFDDNGAFATGILDDFTQWLFEGATDYVDADLLVFIFQFQALKRFRCTHQCNATTRHNSFFHGGAGCVHCIFNTSFFLFQFGFSCGPNFDDGDATNGRLLFSRRGSFTVPAA